MATAAPPLKQSRHRMKPEEFGARLRDLREAKGVTQKQLAAFLKVSHATVSVWESGGNTPNFVQVVKIAEFLGVPVEEFAVIPDDIRPRTIGRPKKKHEDEDE